MAEPFNCFMISGCRCEKDSSVRPNSGRQPSEETRVAYWIDHQEHIWREQDVQEVVEAILNVTIPLTNRRDILCWPNRKKWESHSLFSVLLYSWGTPYKNCWLEPATTDRKLRCVAHNLKGRGVQLVAGPQRIGDKMSSSSWMWQQLLTIFKGRTLHGG